MFAAAALAVAWFSLRPNPGVPPATGWDKLDHAGAFALLALLGTLGGVAARLPLGAALLGYGAAIEVAQAFIPGRSAEWGDVLADAIGVAAGLVAAGAASRMVAASARR